MGKGRLEAFSDGVMAIIITIMVLEIKVPHGADLNALWQVVPVVLSYALSFLYVGIYWNNHHHLLHAVKHINGRVLWANLHLLFWLSLIPVTTGWINQNHSQTVPVMLYGLLLLMAGVAYLLLTRALLSCHLQDSVLASAIGRDEKSKLSLAIYALAVLIALWLPWVSCGLYILVALIWLMPDRRIEKILIAANSVVRQQGL